MAKNYDGTLFAFSCSCDFIGLLQYTQVLFCREQIE